MYLEIYLIRMDGIPSNATGIKDQMLSEQSNISIESKWKIQNEKRKI
jgi:hypothetical protein